MFNDRTHTAGVRCPAGHPMTPNASSPFHLLKGLKPATDYAMVDQGAGAPPPLSTNEQKETHVYFYTVATRTDPNIQC